MQIKRYEAQSMKDGLKQVKSDLGAEAIILSAKSLPRPTAFWEGGESMVEIIAANDRPGGHEPEQRKRDISDIATELKPMREDILDLKEAVSRVVYPRVPLPPSFDRVFQEMVFHGVHRELALKLTLDALDIEKKNGRNDPGDRKAALASVVQKIPPSCPISLKASGEREIVALVGPTGVGKTTTLVKLAAHFAVRVRKRVALLTNDSYRIAAIEQLKVYGKIMDLPVTVVETPSDLLTTIRRLEDVDLVLIDTAGRSQRDRSQIQELKRLFDGQPVTKHLVLSCHTKERELEQVAERFGCLDLDRLLFTKLDEATTFGTILNLAFATQLPLSYLTTGQKVPEDIREATPQLIAQLIFSVTPSKEGVRTRSGLQQKEVRREDSVRGD